MSDILLTGLTGSHPLAALAAFGLLRVCGESQAIGPAWLFWKREADWLAVLRTESPVTSDDLVAFLAARQSQYSLHFPRKPNEF
jgi:hypothetical protein